jgi:hypothetical protein
MRWTLFLVLALGCTRSNLAINGEGDDGGANDLSMSSSGDLSGPQPDLRFQRRDMTLAPADLFEPPSCLLICGKCHPGEWCDAFGNCRCGTGAGCPPEHPICASPGAVMPNMCGSLCCGGTSPCPG